jgi:hypothetical protein
VVTKSSARPKGVHPGEGVSNVIIDQTFQLPKILFSINQNTHPQSLRFSLILPSFFADVVELVDTPDLGSGAERCAGSSPSFRT